MIVTRFAPSPTGELHLGHAHSALFAHGEAMRAGGRFLLRIEDIDQSRCRPEFADSILADLAWLGLDWEKPVRRQSDHFDDYRAALERLEAAGLLYPCFCTRKDIVQAGNAPHGPDGPVYPGICRPLSAAERHDRIQSGIAYALRLDMTAATERVGALNWHDRAAGWVEARPDLFGDVVLARKDTPTSYHLAVTVDDAAQGVTLVTRGEDLFAATHVHRLLQALLGLPVPDHAHHRLLTDAEGRRYAKRDRSLTLRALREAGASPARVRDMAGMGEAFRLGRGDAI
ncbi:tRNA glutamyl-Q(34) synthetase GluQRS [Magnetospirillum sp. SS-4]|uniref:tRNA glutamyl-Q(34) synthetase GluQRS n=1 Tax=Magnetospirillum sp. SS-4 TaxID=2681465 RepID=UPI00137D5573|nr:tRNA glutamyl-Q(34) synthetase GluQRS [Magnetospirillum sp. SS-4]CAA7627469.1 Glutamyl-Q tRNA(Asp) synthetase [Magnetospirillum sp. SS-4]